MFVELAAECLEHGHEGRHNGQRNSSLVVAAGVLVASHRWLECGKMLRAEIATAEFYAQQDIAEVSPNMAFILGPSGTSVQRYHSICQVVVCKVAHSYLSAQLSFSNLYLSQVVQQQRAV